MDKQAQQEARETRAAQPQRQPEYGAPEHMAASPARAVAILRQGGTLAQLRPEDAIALGARIGNSAMGALLGGWEGVMVEPFAYTPPERAPEPFPITAVPPAPYTAPNPLTWEDTGLTPFPAAALRGGDTGGTGGGLDGISL